jgi:hypothetical protein
VNKVVGGKNSDREFVRLRGRLAVENPEEKARRRAEFEAYRRKLRIQELQALLAAGEAEEQAS